MGEIMIQYFVKEDSVVRKIWGTSDTILFIFGGASAEFALNKAVDWLYYTGRLPNDPLGRLFSTVKYARMIVFSEMEVANAAIDKISAIHTAVEKSRGSQIPDWAYRDVLYMLIHYSVSSFELLERKLSNDEKEEVFNVFYRVGCRMGLKDLPVGYSQWLDSRKFHLENDLIKSDCTIDLYKQYRKHLGYVRYLLLKEGQKLVVPTIVAKLMGFNRFYFLKYVLWVYKLLKKFRLHHLLKAAILPKAYQLQINELDMDKAVMA